MRRQLKELLERYDENVNKYFGQSCVSEGIKNYFPFLIFHLAVLIPNRRHFSKMGIVLGSCGLEFLRGSL